MKPVFIIGAGRSGTTLLYKLFCLNNNFAWISNYMARYPSFLVLSALNRVNRKLPNLNLYSWFNKESNAFYGDRKIIKKILPTPVEGEVIYRKGGFKTFPDSDWILDDSTKNYFRCLIEKIAGYQGKDYFLSKRTANNRRIKQLLECFPDAKFINITRDGRAVAHSLTKVKWWNDHKIWWMDQRTPSELRRQNYNDIELAAKNWVEEIRCIRDGVIHINAENILTLKYEDFSENSEKYMLKCLQHIGIEADTLWLDSIKKIKIYNNNHLWKKNLGQDEQELVTSIQSDELRKLDYL